MTFKYSCGETEGSCYTDFNTPTHNNVMSEFNDDALVRKVKFEKTDDFGTYEVEILHDIKGAQIETNIVSFVAHKGE